VSDLALTVGRLKAVPVRGRDPSRAIRQFV
jgi:hypothetical protein